MADDFDVKDFTLGTGVTIKAKEIGSPAKKYPGHILYDENGLEVDFATMIYNLTSMTTALEDVGPLTPAEAVATVQAFSGVLGRNPSPIVDAYETTIVAAGGSGIYHTVEKLIVVNYGPQGCGLDVCFDESTQILTFPIPAPNSNETFDVAGLVFDLGRLRQATANKAITVTPVTTYSPISINLIVSMTGSSGAA